mmetsp:Transcript_10916/g.18688  ORF Transcript_10916/g.18688 Transcript_10916/m.18688 type:complete len:153 (-) Transcript_10916:560-1018(-)|eukprot:CAMPEP_0198198942 /NCGR_PEP_ID=MMETSP1445-20131203/2297_1 /TAXON_ID=36898 /ORGANISM="Pyramimonas sp., Strain CCMP2087" /LENGTH=152 /DNA_ID=CAMNT_0043868621 /DNA_START=280 /DNA_END=738 /DNA_ORIENTATION=+
MLWSLTSVFKAHRFVAGGAGLALLLLPKQVSKVFCPKRHVPEEELLVMRSWGVFVLAVASIVHAAPTFPLEAQQAIGKALASCFALETALYAKEAATMRNPPTGFRAQVAFTGAIFAAIATAYITALVKPTRLSPTLHPTLRTALAREDFQG